MIRLCKCTLVKCALVLVVLVIATPLAVGQGGARTLVVSVQDAEGQPLKNACVTFITRDGAIVFRKADARGKVKLKNLSAQGGRVIARVDGYEAQKQNVALLTDQEMVTFRLQSRSR